MHLPDLPVMYTRHAKGRMRWRRIERADVAAALSDPDRIERVDVDRVHIWKTIRGRTLRVIIVVEADQIVVITAMEKS